MESRLIKMTRDTKAFTLAELLVTLVITSILLLSVTALAFAMSSATKVSDDTMVKEAQLRQARLRIGELIRNCKLICAAPGNDLAIWAADPNNDGQIHVRELVYIERGNTLNTLQLCRFAPTEGDVVTLGDLAPATIKDLLISKYAETRVALIPACQNVQFHLDAAPPFTRRVTISFLMVENGTPHPYEVSTALRGWAGNLLNEAGNAIVGDDD